MEIPKNLDVSQLMNMLSKMDEKQLKDGLNKINQMLNDKNNGQNYNGKGK